MDRAPVRFYIHQFIGTVEKRPEVVQDRIFAVRGPIGYLLMRAEGLRKAEAEAIRDVLNDMHGLGRGGAFDPLPTAKEE